MVIRYVHHRSVWWLQTKLNVTMKRRSVWKLLSKAERITSVRAPKADSFHLKIARRGRLARSRQFVAQSAV